MLQVQAQQERCAVGERVKLCYDKDEERFILLFHNVVEPSCLV